MKKDGFSKLTMFFTAGAALILYLVLRRFTGLSVPCVFHKITGLKCPGCGITRMLDSLIVLDMEGARKANTFIFFTSPFLLFELIYEFLLPHRNKRFRRINNILLIIYCVLLIAFGIIRNLA